MAEGGISNANVDYRNVGGPSHHCDHSRRHQHTYGQRAFGSEWLKKTRTTGTKPTLGACCGNYLHNTCRNANWLSPLHSYHASFKGGCLDLILMTMLESFIPWRGALVKGKEGSAMFAEQLIIAFSDDIHT